MSKDKEFSIYTVEELARMELDDIDLELEVLTLDDFTDITGA